MENPNNTHGKGTLADSDCDVIIKDDYVTNDDTIEKTVNTQQYKWYHINWSMVPTKLAYFCETGRRLGFAPNLVLFLISVGLNKEESGFIAGLRHVIYFSPQSY